MNKSSSSSSIASASGSSKYDTPGMLHQILANEDYALALAPGFFRFYAHIGILQALEEKGCLRPSHITGSSAGAMVGGFLASGMTPTEMIKTVLDIKRADIWDVGGVCGLLKGQLFHNMLVKHLPVPTIEVCKYPLGVTTFDLLGLRTRCLTTGCLATAMRTSCTFPGLFQPVMIEGSPNIDGGVFDGVGLMALPSVLGLDPSVPSVDVPSSDYTTAEQNTLTEVISPAKQSEVEAAPESSKKGRKTPSKSAKKAPKVNTTSKASTSSGASASTNAAVTEEEQAHRAAQVHSFSHLVVNVVFGRASISSSVLPPQLKTHKLLTVVVENVPMVYPHTMDAMGIVAYRVARAATLKSLHSTHMQELAPHHWCCYIDGASVNPDEFPLPSVPGPQLSRENLRAALLKRTLLSDDTSSADSAHIEHSWTTQATQAQRRSAKRKLALPSATSSQTQLQAQAQDQQGNQASSGSTKKMRTRSSAFTVEDDRSSDTSSSSGEESEHSDPAYDENEDMNSRILRTGFNSIPSFSFLNGTYRMYDAAVSRMSDTMHRIEDAGNAVSSTLHSIEGAIEGAGSAIMHDASTVFQAVRSTLKTVVHDLEFAPAEDTAGVSGTNGTGVDVEVDSDDDPVGGLSGVTRQSMRRKKASPARRRKSAVVKDAKSAPSSAKKASSRRKSSA